MARKRGEILEKVKKEKEVEEEEEHLKTSANTGRKCQTACSGGGGEEEFSFFFLVSLFLPAEKKLSISYLAR